MGEGGRGRRGGEGRLGASLGNAGLKKFKVLGKCPNSENFEKNGIKKKDGKSNSCYFRFGENILVRKTRYFWECKKK